MPEHLSVPSYVLAGGLSARMGQDKARVLLHGRTLIERALETLSGLGGPPPCIAAARPDLASYAQVLPDLHPHCGPLSGIEAALAATTHPYGLFLPVDLPLLPASFLGWMLGRALSAGALATVPRIHGRPQPLCALYHRDLLPSITASLQAGRYKVMPVIAAAASSPLPSIDLFDTEKIAATNPAFSSFSPHPPHRWFFNCNTLSDLAALDMLYS